VFFATAGAHLDLPLLATMWPIALSLCVGRFAGTFASHQLGTRWAGDSALLRRWGWASLISQAGLTLGLAVVIARNFPAFGESFRSLVVASVAINEVVGPILFKVALDRVGEVGAAGPGQSLHPPPPHAPARSLPPPAIVHEPPKPVPLPREARELGPELAPESPAETQAEPPHE